MDSGIRRRSMQRSIFTGSEGDNTESLSILVSIRSYDPSLGWNLYLRVSSLQTLPNLACEDRF